MSSTANEYDSYGLLDMLKNSPNFLTDYKFHAVDKGSGLDGNRRYMIREYVNSRFNITGLKVNTVNWLNRELNRHCNLPEAIPYRNPATAPAAAEACAVDINDLYQPTEKEPTMSNVCTLRTVTYYGSRDVTTLTDDEIFDIVKELENAILMLNNINNKSIKLSQRIGQYQDTIEQLNKIVDARP